MRFTKKVYHKAYSRLWDRYYDMELSGSEDLEYMHGLLIVASLIDMRYFLKYDECLHYDRRDCR